MEIRSCGEKRLRINIRINKINKGGKSTLDGFVKSPSAALRFTFAVALTNEEWERGESDGKS
jgi:ribosomal protein S20